MAEAEVGSFLSHLAVDRNVASSLGGREVPDTSSCFALCTFQASTFISA